MNDSIPPIPPAPHYPANQVPGSYAPSQYAPHHNPEHPRQPFGAYAKGPYSSNPDRSKSSGFRVAAGIVGIVCGVWFLVPSIAGFQEEGGTALMALPILVAALGNVAAGIVLLANQRRRSQWAPVASLVFAGLAMLLGMIGVAVPYYGPALLVSALALAAPVLIVMGIGLAKERRGH